MEEIKEIRRRFDLILSGLVNSRQVASEAIKYIDNLLAELQKDATPVAWTRPDATYSFITHKRKLANEYQADRLYSIPLYPHPQPKAATVPEGYVLVPKEPTDEMIAAAMGRYKHASDSAAREFVEFHRENFKHDYRAMIEATPSLPAAQSEGEQK